MSSARDYTDSESDGEGPTPSRPFADAISTPGDSPGPASPTKAGPTEPVPLKITLRPGLHHLQPEQSPSASPPPDRSSLSPPPPIKLKLGMKHARQAATYSSDESDGGKSKDRSPPTKKPRTKKAPKDKPEGPKMPAQHRKSYDWLQPSSASASHHGPPDRSHLHVPNAMHMEEDRRAGSVESVPESAKGTEKKRSGGRKKADGPAGPGKNWRKGLKKGDPMPWKDGTPFMSEHRSARSSPHGTPMRGSVSREVSPDIDAILLAAASHDPEASGQPFVPADPIKLGFPVFSHPIQSPKIPLGPFPKITQFFAPFDQKPLRKEKVREWTFNEKTIQGVGGGQLKFKTWSRGPTSDLGRFLALQKEAEAAAKARKKESKESREKDLEHHFERPGFTHSASADSVSRAASADVDETSEAGDGEESAAATPRESPAPRRGRKGERKPRKSKLAQEIIPTEAEDEGESSKVAV